MHKISYKDLKVEHICKNSLKHSYISVKNVSYEAIVYVKTPRVSATFVKNLLIEKESWIRKQIEKIENSTRLEIKFEDEVLLFGEIYSIDSQEATPLRDKLNKMSVSNQKTIAKHYENFYRTTAKEYLTQRVNYYSKIMNLEYAELKFRKMKSRWGSCSSKKTITLNTELIKVKKEQIDYVVVHELSHLVHMNHSNEFHAFVDSYLSNSKEIRKDLKKVFIVFT